MIILRVGIQRSFFTRVMWQPPDMSPGGLKKVGELNRDLRAGAGVCASELPMSPHTIQTKSRADSLPAPNMLTREGEKWPQRVPDRNEERTRRVDPKFTTADVTWSRDAPEETQTAETVLSKLYEQIYLRQFSTFFCSKQRVS